MSKASDIDNEALFQVLRARPLIAWPTVIVLLSSLLTITAVWLAVTADIIPLWTGTLINFIAYYYLFAPIHDGTHRSISSNDKLNDFFMALAFLPVSAVMGGTGWARMFHMQHHRHAGKATLDPDVEISSKGSNALSRWFIWGFHYSAYYKKFKAQLPSVKTPVLNKTRILISALFFAYVIWHFPLEFIFLWVVPLYTGISWMTAFIFSYLPHHIHKRQADKNPLDDGQATCNFIGYEWIMSPITQCQNYHLVHHLYPTVPFYRYARIWRARQSIHLEAEPSLIHLSRSK